MSTNFSPENLSIETTLSGVKTVRDGARSLLSRSHPWVEAEKLLSAAGLTDDVPLMIIGDFLGYGTAAAFKSGRQTVLTIYPEKRFLSESVWNGPGETTFFAAADFEEKINRFLSLKNIAVWEMPAAAPYYENERNRLHLLIKKSMQEQLANDTVEIAFSRSWLSNALRFFQESRRSIGMLQADLNTPILIAAPGPSLEAVIPSIIRYRERFLLTAVTSAAAVLQSHGIRADFYFAVDPGFYARKLCLFLNPPVCGWILPPTANVPASNAAAVPFRQNLPPETAGGSFWNTENFPLLPEMPTVTASAFLFFQSFKQKAFAGLDLTAPAGKPYARGHLAIQEAHLTACRLSPAENRFLTGKHTRPLSVFKDLFTETTKRIGVKPIRLCAPVKDNAVFCEEDTSWFESLPANPMKATAFATVPQLQKAISEAAQNFLTESIEQVSRIQTAAEVGALPAAVRAAAFREAIRARNNISSAKEFQKTALRRLKRWQNRVR